ncbi:putative oligoribonuclease [Ciona intestinalis]
MIQCCRKFLRLLSSNLVKIVRNFAMAGDDARNRMIWVDLEMTGLDVNKDHILEMACLVTDGNLNVIAQEEDLVIHQSDEVLKNMNEWCIEHHGKSGLTESVRKSMITLTQAEDIMLKFIQKHAPYKVCPLAGNTIHADKRFLDHYMPRFMDHLHYRIVDVSSIKELSKRWYPNVLPPPKGSSHRALEDILESIAELKFYRKTLFV